MKSLTTKLLIAMLLLVSANAFAGTYTLYCNSLVQSKLSTATWGAHLVELKVAMKNAGYTFERDADGRGSDFNTVSASNVVAPNPGSAMNIALDGICTGQRNSLSDTIANLRLRLEIVSRNTSQSIIVTGTRWQCAYVYEGSALVAQTCQLPLSGTSF